MNPSQDGAVRRLRFRILAWAVTVLGAAVLAGGVAAQQPPPVWQWDYPQIAAGDAGAFLHQTDGDTRIALRVFELSDLSVNLSPLTPTTDISGMASTGSR